MQSQKTVFRPLNARTPPAADTDRAGPALPPSKQISKGNRQSAFPRRWIRCGGVIPFVYIIWISRTATPSRRNGGVVAPERRYRLAGTAIPLRRNSRACKKGAPISPAGQVPKACRLRLPIRQSTPSAPNRRPSRGHERTFPWARPLMRRFRRSSRLFHDGWTKASSGAVSKAPRQGGPGERPHLRKRVRGRPVTRSYCSHGRGSGGARRVSPDGL